MFDVHGCAKIGSLATVSKRGGSVV